MQDLVRVGVADAAEEARIGERTFERVVSRAELLGECSEIDLERLEAARVELGQSGRAPQQVQRGAFFRPCFGERECACREVEGQQPAAAGELGARGLPMRAARDHQVQDGPEVVFEAEGDAFADTPELLDSLAAEGGGGRVGGSQQERAGDPHAFEFAAEQALLESFDVDRDVGQLRHLPAGFHRPDGLGKRVRGPPHVP